MAEGFELSLDAILRQIPFAFCSQPYATSDSGVSALIFNVWAEVKTNRPMALADYCKRLAECRLQAIQQAVRDEPGPNY